MILLAVISPQLADIVAVLLVSGLTILIAMRKITPWLLPPDVTRDLD